jgi:hypothetical protein
MGGRLGRPRGLARPFVHEVEVETVSTSPACSASSACSAAAPSARLHTKPNHTPAPPPATAVEAGRRPPAWTCLRQDEAHEVKAWPTSAASLKPRSSTACVRSPAAPAFMSPVRKRRGSSAASMVMRLAGGRAAAAALFHDVAHAAGVREAAHAALSSSVPRSPPAPNRKGASRRAGRPRGRRRGRA